MNELSRHIPTVPAEARQFAFWNMDTLVTKSNLSLSSNQGFLLTPADVRTGSLACSLFLRA